VSLGAAEWGALRAKSKCQARREEITDRRQIQIDAMSPSTPSSVPLPKLSALQRFTEDAEWKAIKIDDHAKTWKHNMFVPIGLLGGAVLLGAALVIKGRGDGRGLSQRIMEARVAAQGTLLLVIVMAGYALGKTIAPENAERAVRAGFISSPALPLLSLKPATLEDGR
jgi:hypothetical protein